MDRQEEKFAKALRDAQIETGKNITPKDAFVIWNDYEFDEICGFKVLYCPTISKCTLAFVDERNSYNKLTKIFEDYME
jgi:hypothetical protein